MRSTIFWFVFWIGLSPLLSSASARVICKTADGQTYATEHPPPGCRAERSATTDEPVAAGDEVPSANDSTQSERMQAVGICEQSVAELLENPSAARWPSRSEYRVQRQGPGQFAIDGYVDVANALGEVRTPWTCRAIRGFGDRWQAAAKLSPPSPSGAAPAQWPEPAQPRFEPAPPPPPAPQAAPPPAAVAPAAEPPAWSPVKSCRHLHVRDAFAEKFADRRVQVVKGFVEYSGSPPIRDARVCAGGVCAPVSFSPQGGAQPFTLEVPTLDVVTVTVECSMLGP